MRLAALALLLIAAVTASVASADASSRLAPTADALHAERTAVLEKRVTRLLTALPSVERATVSLSLPNPLSEPLDAPATPPGATVLLVGTAPRDDVVRIVQSHVPNLATERVVIVEHAPKAPAEASSFVQIGPFRVHPSSAASLRVWLAISLLANVLLAGIVLSRLRRA